MGAHAEIFVVVVQQGVQFQPFKTDYCICTVQIHRG